LESIMLTPFPPFSPLVQVGVQNTMDGGYTTLAGSSRVSKTYSSSIHGGYEQQAFSTGSNHGTSVRLS